MVPRKLLHHQQRECFNKEEPLNANKTLRRSSLQAEQGGDDLGANGEEEVKHPVSEEDFSSSERNKVTVFSTAKWHGNLDPNHLFPYSGQKFEPVPSYEAFQHHFAC